jgi:hypothetical protein
MDVQGVIVISIALMILGGPIWLPILMLVYHACTAKPFWRFSLRFLLALTALECVALAISVAFYRFLDFMFSNWPVPG